MKWTALCFLLFSFSWSASGQSTALNLDPVSHQLTAIEDEQKATSYWQNGQFDQALVHFFMALHKTTVERDQRQIRTFLQQHYRDVHEWNTQFIDRELAYFSKVIDFDQEERRLAYLVKKLTYVAWYQELALALPHLLLGSDQDVALPIDPETWVAEWTAAHRYWDQCLTNKAEAHYQLGRKQLLQDTKQAYQRAVWHFKKAETYKRPYKNSQQLVSEYGEKGRWRIGVLNVHTQKEDAWISDSFVRSITSDDARCWVDFVDRRHTDLVLKEWKRVAAGIYSQDTEPELASLRAVDYLLVGEIQEVAYSVQFSQAPLATKIARIRCLLNSEPVPRYPYVDRPNPLQPHLSYGTTEQTRLHVSFQLLDVRTGDVVWTLEDNDLEQSLYSQDLQTTSNRWEQTAYKLSASQIREITSDVSKSLYKYLQAENSETVH